MIYKSHRPAAIANQIVFWCYADSNEENAYNKEAIQSELIAQNKIKKAEQMFSKVLPNGWRKWYDSDR